MPCSQGPIVLCTQSGPIGGCSRVRAGQLDCILNEVRNTCPAWQKSYSSTNACLRKAEIFHAPPPGRHAPSMLALLYFLTLFLLSYFPFLPLSLLPKPIIKYIL